MTDRDLIETIRNCLQVLNLSEDAELGLETKKKIRHIVEAYLEALLP